MFFCCRTPRSDCGGRRRFSCLRRRNKLTA
jgi:hypothetical protein